MARIRTIKPEFFTSEDIVGMSPLARLFYVSLWCESDREGRLEWKPGTFKMRYFPGDSCEIMSLANELISMGLVILYEAKGKTYAEIPTFKEHQVINNREAESLIPSREIDASPRVKAEGRKEGKGKEGREGKEGVDRATRLPTELELPDTWQTFCQSERQDLDPQKTFDRFKDYWIAKPGKDGAKLDWMATWRNWVRDQRAQPGKQMGQKTFAERDREAGWARWEEQTGKIHPDRQKAQGHVIDVTPRNLEIEQ